MGKGWLCASEFSCNHSHAPYRNARSPFHGPGLQNPFFSETKSSGEPCCRHQAQVMAKRQLVLPLESAREGKEKSVEMSKLVPLRFSGFPLQFPFISLHSPKPPRQSPFRTPLQSLAVSHMSPALTLHYRFISLHCGFISRSSKNVVFQPQEPSQMKDSEGHMRGNDGRCRRACMKEQFKGYSRDM